MGRRAASKIGEQEKTLEGSASIEIVTPKQLVWNLIKPAENAPLMEPSITRGFRAEGTPRGTGDIQVFIHTIGGEEQVVAVEIVDEVAEEYSITRPIGGGQYPPTTGYFLTDTAAGTRLEVRHRFSFARYGSSYARNLMTAYEESSRAMLQRVKVIAESRWNNQSSGLRAWHGNPNKD